MSWILPSRGRPQNLKRLIDAWHATEAQTTVRLRLDDDDPTLDQCLSLALPDTWVRDVGPRLPLSEIYNSAFRKQPERPWMGFIGDDCLPVGLNWDTRLVSVAVHTGGMAVPSGGHDPEGTPHFVLSGDLVRSVGWLALPGLNRLFIDTVWADIARSRGLLEPVPDVEIKHLHFSNRLALFDETYRKRHKDQDRKLYEQWRRNEGTAQN